MSTNRESDEVIFALHSRTATFLAATVLLQQSIGIAKAGSLPTGLISMGLFIGQLVTLLIYERNTNRQKGSTLRALCLATPSLLQAALWVVAADTWWHALIACLFGSVVFYAFVTHAGGYLHLGANRLTARLGIKTLALQYHEITDAYKEDISFLFSVGPRFHTFVRLTLTTGTKLPGIPFNGFTEKTISLPLPREERDRALVLIKDKLQVASGRNPDP